MTTFGGQTIQLGPLSYRVEYVPELKSEDGNDLYGRICYPECKIEVDAQFAGGQREPLIVWHEVLHGILDLSGLEDDNEALIVVLAYGICEALQRNPILRLE